MRMRLHDRKEYKMNTPSGTNKTALDKFIINYMNQGYCWEFDNDNIIFTKENNTKLARAIYNDNHHIIGFNVLTIK